MCVTVLSLVQCWLQSLTDDRGKMAVLHLVHGYLVVLGSRVAQFTRSLPHLTRLTQALLQVQCNTM